MTPASALGQARNIIRAKARSASRLRGRSLLPIVILAVLIPGPLVLLLQRALDDGAAGFVAMAQLPGIGETIATTAYLGVGSCVVALILGTGLAWAVQRLPARVRGVAGIVPIVPLMVPAVAEVIGWSFLASPRVGYLNTALRQTPLFDHLAQGPLNVYSLPWIVALSGFSLTSYVYIFVTVGLRNIGSDYTAAARAAGASATRAFFTVTLPLLRPSLVFAAGIVLLLGSGQFTAPLILGRTEGIDTLTTELFGVLQRYPYDWGLAAALGTPLLVVGIGVITLQRLALRNQSRFVVSTGKPMSTESETSWWSLVPVGLYGLVAVGLPLGAITYVAFSPFWSGKFTLQGLTTRHVEKILFDDQRVASAIGNSVFAAVVAVAIVCVIGFFAALGMVSHYQPSAARRSIIDILVTLPIGVPHAVFGFGLLYFYTSSPIVLYGSVTAIIVGYVTIMMPHSTRQQLGALLSLSPDYWHASQASGASMTRTLFRIVLPLARQGIAAAAALMIVLLFHEFTVSVMLRSARTQVMGTVLYDYWSAGTYSEVAAMALLMVAVTAVGVVVAIVLGGRRGVESI